MIFIFTIRANNNDQILNLNKIDNSYDNNNPNDIDLYCYSNFLSSSEMDDTPSDEKLIPIISNENNNSSIIFYGYENLVVTQPLKEIITEETEPCNTIETNNNGVTSLFCSDNENNGLVENSNTK
ncbi:hypothetical protein A0H76_405 [Hepatospora eriocheir]|uniref:Uncharacterized protein n=1 Tax=Hepatospora eriocheir TaxID=1081669 RepID=A0A1X0QAY4_9MICR|nr:hypothetical protein A0H76_405 [Hepatospora eriocheir]